MCGRYILTITGKVLAEAFALEEVPDLPPRYNIAPTQDAPVIRETGGGRRLDILRWGLIPSWARDPAIGNRLINARAETAASKPSFRSALRRRRCLVPSDGFYEWRKTPSGKQPWLIRMRDGSPFAMAGLWETWRTPHGDPLESFTILTTEPNELVAPLHDRMPVILPPESWSTWLDPELDDPSALSHLLGPHPPEAMTAYPVTPAVGSPSFDEPACIKPLQGPHGKPLE